MLGTRANSNPVVFDDVPDAESVARNGAEAELSKRGVAAVGGGDDSVVELVPAAVGEE